MQQAVSWRAGIIFCESWGPGGAG